MIDVAGGDKIPRKRGAGLILADLLVINKIDLAPYVGADLGVMDRDARLVRGERPFLFADCRHGVGIDEIVAYVTAARERFLVSGSRRLATDAGLAVAQGNDHGHQHDHVHAHG